MVKITCPCCLGSGLVEKAAPVHLSPMQLRIFQIVRAQNKGISGPRLTDLVYAGVKDGGPLRANASVYVQIRALNRRLAAIGQRVVCRPAQSGYRLEKVA